MMDFTIEVQHPIWQPVITIPQGSILAKGRRNDWYRTITTAAGNVIAPCGCYCWHTTDKVLYVGSFRPYKNFKSSLHARVHNYLQNHGKAEKKKLNTNRMVFDNLNLILQQSEILFSYLTFESLRLGNDIINFETFSSDPTLVHAVEELLIATYRRAGQCEWNRT
jgi:hypothetical protein